LLFFSSRFENEKKNSKCQHTKNHKLDRTEKQSPMCVNKTPGSKPKYKEYIFFHFEKKKGIETQNAQTRKNASLTEQKKQSPTHVNLQ